ncbi:WD repeat-containing protein CG11141 isoform X2 [Zerene cesonia]|uniref:WD repeat-containing protein CG11141 isoform X2 n=1 Tax=Zerene cesonia TaxID=33412 RepID=UPI0018E57628|nr:WD repeat-containing protein CG11141 isoform X2 [Zerene cesonia]
MEVSSGADEGFVREWTPCSHILNLIPPKIQTGIFSNELCLTCVDAVSEYIALGTNVGLVYWYDRKKGNIQRLRCEASTSPITFVKIVSTVDYMVGAGNATGQVTVFQIPKEHPENVPDTFKPKVEPKVERYTIGDLHKSKITSIEWSKNGMRLFSGDKDGVIIMTEIDFYMHLCKSMEIVNEQHEIVQMSYHQNTLLVSSVYRCIVCERRDQRWHVSQLGRKERKSLCALGAVFQHSYARGLNSGASGGQGPGAPSAGPSAYCARAGLRLWRADRAGNVLQTLLFKEAISNPLTVAELLNPAQQKRSHSEREYNLGPLHVFREHFLVSHNEHFLYVLDPRSLTAVAVVDDLRRILSVSVNKDEIFVLEGGRSLVRLAHRPEPAALAQDEPSAMTKSLTTSLQQAVNTVRDLAHIDQTVPYIQSVLEQPMALFTRNETTEFDANVPNGEECFELPPIKHLPRDISDNVLESIINEFKDVSGDVEEIRRVKSEELQRKLKMYNSIMEKGCEGELIHSRKSRRREVGSGGTTPRHCTPVRREISYTSPCVMNVSVYGIPDQNDDQLEKQIEEKEKILAKMLNLESLSIKTSTDNSIKEENSYKTNIDINTTDNEIPQTKEPEQEEAPKIEKPAQKKTEKIIDLVPKVVQLPNTWNLENIELHLEMKNGMRDGLNLISPDENLDSEWEVI